jgi:hypothetical protein
MGYSALRLNRLCLFCQNLAEQGFDQITHTSRIENCHKLKDEGFQEILAVENQPYLCGG